MNILWVEDEFKIVERVVAFLDQEGCRVTHALCAEAALDLLRKQSFDLILIDWMLPGQSGTDLCREVQRERKVPVIMLTAKTDEWDKVIALEIGADDYITKPFGMRELLARIKAVLRRSGSAGITEDKVLRSGSLTIDPFRHEVKKNDQFISLTPTEFELLVTLAEQPGRVFSRLQLIDQMLGEVYYGYERTIDSHIRNLRRKIEDDPAQPQYIVTVYGVGYRFGGGALP
ncbi:response regulator [Paenibacillus sp. J2TS4]|uniref:response regulator n=1 Tax=Paenibacillus sp. J2TS4 TaxID=2807194 RepID=UPI001B262CF9|nr:response regulator transcription factor [Paenibacillus sp. J2TS4]GIP31415.1 DNA-binding response regulator [Paenibacillus sp. J2TS4]